MKLRVILVCTLLLLAASPSFSLPLCKECNAQNPCEAIPGSIERCRILTGGICDTFPGSCSMPRETTVLSDWTVASIEISRPALDSVTVTAPAAVPEVPTPAPQTTELK